MKNRIILFSVVSLLIIIVASCSTLPRDSTPSTSLTMISQKDIKSGYLGTNQDENPYVEPMNLLHNRQTEFVIIKIEFVTNIKTDVSFWAVVKDEQGKDIADLKSYEDMINFWSFWKGDGTLNNQRSLNIDQTYIPDFGFTAKPGKHIYYAVLMAKYPIARPAIVHAELSVGDLKPVILNEQLPDASVGRPKTIF